MIESQPNEDILFGRICGYCNSQTRIVEDSVIGGSFYKGKKCVCPECDAFVSVDEFSGLPLGMVAHRELRRKRVLIHQKMNILIQQGVVDNREFYLWLSNALNKKRSHCHISMMNEDECDIIIEKIKSEYSFWFTGRFKKANDYVKKDRALDKRKKIRRQIEKEKNKAFRDFQLEVALSIESM